MLGLPAAGEVDVLSDDNAEIYWERSDLFDMALDLTAGRRGLDALGKVIARWIAHLPVEVEVESLTEATGVNLVVRRPRCRGDRDRGYAVARRGARSSCARAYHRSLPPQCPRCRNGAGHGQGRTHLSDTGDDARPHAAHEAANLVTGLPLAHFEAVSWRCALPLRSASWSSADWRRARGSIHLEAGDGARRPARRRAWTMLSQDGDSATFYAGPAEIALYRTETANYRDNLGSAVPMLWVALRPTGVEPPYEIFAVTADPAEGEAWTEAGSDLVDVVPMPEPVHATIDAFVAEHHVEQPFHKRERDRADPEALARRVPTRKSANERAGKLHRAVVAAQARGGARGRGDEAGSRARRCRRACSDIGARRARCRRAKWRAAGVAVRSREPAAARIDHRRERHTCLPRARCSGRTDLCGPSSRVGRGSEDPRLRRARGERLDFNAPGSLAGFGPLEMTEASP